jgi:3-polyprenyl-4-hydroxybenzoate decarboxylase
LNTLDKKKKEKKIISRVGIDPTTSLQFYALPDELFQDIHKKNKKEKLKKQNLK